MTFRGRMQNGVVVFEGTSPPEGVVVDVQITSGPAARSTESGEDANIWDKLLKLKGLAPDLPADAARQHDHYLYGTPKR